MNVFTIGLIVIAVFGATYWGVSVWEGVKTVEPYRQRECLMCGRPLAPRRWWQWLDPPPFCPPKPPSLQMECLQLFEKRFGKDIPS